MEQNSLQERTGQVSPTAQNPQDITAQSLQQPSSNLQPTNNQLLNSPSNIQITVPSSGGTHASQVIHPQAEVVVTNSIFSNSSFVTALGALMIISFTILMIIKKSVKPMPKPELESEATKAVKINVISEPKVITSSKPKKKTNKRKKKSVKK